MGSYWGSYIGLNGDHLLSLATALLLEILEPQGILPHPLTSCNWAPSTGTPLSNTHSPVFKSLLHSKILEGIARLHSFHLFHLEKTQILSAGVTVKFSTFSFFAIKSAAAAAKSLQSCPTLCDPIDGSPPGSGNPTIPGILQATGIQS